MLQIGQTFPMGGHHWTVRYVNSSRAHCVTAIKKIVTVHDRKKGARTFEANHYIVINISPNAAIELLQEMDS